MWDMHIYKKREASLHCPLHILRLRKLPILSKRATPKPHDVCNPAHNHFTESTWRILCHTLRANSLCMIIHTCETFTVALSKTGYLKFSGFQDVKFKALVERLSYMSAVPTDSYLRTDTDTTEIVIPCNISHRS